mmetsp:Transcript_75663/g.239215  ORF Transcript_75663/g.239215 Transcript_75663/m.239215 type:complete len:219 (-) Transcript_75663:206-862(-)
MWSCRVAVSVLLQLHKEAMGAVRQLDPRFRGQLRDEALVPRPAEEDADLLVEHPARRVAELAIATPKDVAAREGPVPLLLLGAPDSEELDLLLGPVHIHGHDHCALREEMLLAGPVSLHHPMRLHGGHAIEVRCPDGAVVGFLHALEDLNLPPAVELELPQRGQHGPLLWHYRWDYHDLRAHLVCVLLRVLLRAHLEPLDDVLRPLALDWLQFLVPPH